MSKADARRELISARREMARMDRELSGCDWCCGGGDEAYGRASAAAAEALKVLDGEDLPTPCSECAYYDAREGHRTCDKCSGTLETT